MSIEYVYRPIVAWEGPLNPDRDQPRFTTTFSQAKKLMQREVEALSRNGWRDHVEVVIQLAIRESDIRTDGQIRVNLRAPDHPGVVVSFESKHGPLRYATDLFDGKAYGRQNSVSGWQANFYAVALSLEALRKVDRYGVSGAGEQYTGWSALPPATPMGPAPMTREQAARLIADADPNLNADDWPHILAHADAGNVSELRFSYRRASLHFHPDQGGDETMFKKLNDAYEFLKASRG